MLRDGLEISAGGIDPERWESGSDFELSLDTGQADLPWAGLPHAYYGCGRDAIRGLFEWGRETRGWRRLLMPSYFCQDVVGSTQRSAPVETYAWAPTGEESEAVHTRDGDAVFVSAMFGAAPKVAITGPGEIIEDHSHDLGADWVGASRADYALASLRKTFPLPDGGVVWSPRGLEVPSEPEMTPEHASTVLAKLSAMVLKREYLIGNDVAKAEYFGIGQLGEQAMSRGRISGMSAFSKARLPSLPTRAWREVRARNIATLQAEIGDIAEARFLDVTFAAVLLFDEAETRERVRRHLISVDVYPSILWPLERPVVSGIPAEHVEVSRRIMSIHCDHRYGADDMARIAADLHRALGRP